MSTPPEVVRFSTDSLPERRRLPIWRETIDQLAMKMEIASISEGPFRVEAAFRTLPNVGLTNISNTPYEISSRLSAGNDDLLFNIFCRGGTVARQRDREVEVTTGQAMLWSNEYAGWANFQSDTERLILVFPRQVLAPMVTEIDKAVMAALPPDSSVIRLIAGYARELLGNESLLSPELRAATATHLQDLVVMALGATRDAAEIANGRGVRVARLKAIKADVEANLAGGDLSLDALSRRHGISPRYVRALFNGEGTSFTDYVLGRRLLHAHRAISNPMNAGRKISTLAFESGFGDLSYFNQAFRRQFGQTPSDARALSLRL